MIVQGEGGGILGVFFSGICYRFGRNWIDEHKTNFNIISACWAPGCLFALSTTNTYGYVKLAFAALIMISSTYFVYLSRKYNVSNLAQATNLSNQTSQKRIVV